MWVRRNTVAFVALQVATKFIQGLYITQVSRKPVYCIDPYIPEFGTVPNVSKGWEEFYEVYTKAVLFDEPEPRGVQMKITCFVDALNALNEVTQRFNEVT